MNREDSPRGIVAVYGGKIIVMRGSREFLSGEGGGVILFAKGLQRRVFGGIIFGNLCEFNKFDFFRGFGSSF